MIRFATKSDIENLMNFIYYNWRKNHILSINRSFFEYEHCDGEKVNFVISLDKDNNINGMQGFIPYGKKHRDITKNLWRALKCEIPHLGSKILEFLIQNSDARTVASIGSNPKTLSIYNRIGFHVGELSQWYRLCPINSYVIANICDSFIPRTKLKSKSWFELKTMQDFIENFDFDWYVKEKMIPFKEKWYIEKRYYNHPIYKYNIFGVRNDNNNMRLALVFRIEEYYGAKAIRLIDCIGDYNLLYYVTNEIDNFMRIQKAEYVDFYESGVNSNMMIDAGWLKVKGSDNIIPNYFSPYEQRNVSIHYASSSSTAVYFKGDGDQDRPN